MLQNRLSKYTLWLIFWVLLGFVVVKSSNGKTKYPGSDFPKPDSTRYAIGWDFDNQCYRYHEPNQSSYEDGYSYEYEYYPEEDFWDTLEYLAD